jgi:glutamine amidotransferase
LTCNGDVVKQISEIDNEQHAYLVGNLAYQDESEALDFEARARIIGDSGSGMEKGLIKRIGVVDHGVGNSIAILNLLRKIGIEAVKIKDATEFDGLSPSDSKIVIPGVGSFDAGMNALRVSRLDMAISKFAAAGGGILGICLGMQLLFERSDEGSSDGLGLIPGDLIAIKSNPQFRVPHVGWESVIPVKEDLIFSGITRLTFYHNHSYGLPSPSPFEIARIQYSDQFVVAARNENVVGVQFHPEKSHSSGEQLMKNFINL